MRGYDNRLDDHRSCAAHLDFLFHRLLSEPFQDLGHACSLAGARHTTDVQNARLLRACVTARSTTGPETPISYRFVSGQTARLLRACVEKFPKGVRMPSSSAHGRTFRAPGLRPCVAHTN